MEIVAEKIMVDHYYHRDSRKKANEIVREFIISKQLIVTGGLVIDFALRLKGEKIYEDFAVPDYDFFSTHNAHDACELFELLRSNGFTNISLVPGIHPSTIKIFVYKDCVADITFTYESLFEDMKKSALIYNGMMFRNPYIQYVDMHRALTYPYENEPRETINNRWAKDFERFCLLYKYYPTEQRTKTNHELPSDKGLDFTYVVAGQYAIRYYLSKYGMKVESDTDLGEIVYLMDEADIEAFMVKHGSSIKNLKQFKAFGEILPERTELKLNDIKHVLLHCRNKTSIYYIDGQEEAIKLTLKKAQTRMSLVRFDGGDEIIPNKRIVSINFCVIFSYAMFKITGNEVYNWYYNSLLKLTYDAYIGGITDLYPSVTIYGQESDNPIIVYASEHPEARVPRIHISDDNDEATNAEHISKLPWDFTYEPSIYVLDGSLIQ